MEEDSCSRDCEVESRYFYLHKMFENIENITLGRRFILIENANWNQLQKDIQNIQTLNGELILLHRKNKKS